MSEATTPKVFRTVMVPVGNFRRPERNPNVMSDRDYQMLVEGIRRTGFLQPILGRAPEPPRAPTSEDDDETVERLLAEDAAWRLSVLDIEIVDGDHRYQAAVECGMPEVPAVVGEFDERTARLLQIGMNRLRGELDLGQVAKVLDELAEGGLRVDDLAVSGYPADEVDALLAAMKPDAEDLADVDAMGGSDGPAPEAAAEDGAYELTIALRTRKEQREARKKLKKLGGGDLRAGLLRVLSDEEE